MIKPMDKCVICGRYIPEGRQVCVICERDAAIPRKEAEIS